MHHASFLFALCFLASCHLVWTHNYWADGSVLLAGNLKFQGMAAKPACFFKSSSQNSIAEFTVNLDFAALGTCTYDSQDRGYCAYYAAVYVSRYNAGPPTFNYDDNLLPVVTPQSGLIYYTNGLTTNVTLPYVWHLDYDSLTDAGFRQVNLGSGDALCVIAAYRCNLDTYTYSCPLLDMGYRYLGYASWTYRYPDGLGNYTRLER